MASSEQQVPPRTPAADTVGNAFVHQYYHILHESPELVHKFYQDVSKLGCPEQNGLMGITTTLEDINKKILSLGYGELSVEIISVDTQESYGGGFLVLVTGFITGGENIKQKFTQCFFLAPQEIGYFVLNDVFRYVNKDGIQGSDRDIGSPVSHDNVANPAVFETQVSAQIPVTAEGGEGEEIYNPENGQAPVPEAVNEIPDDSQMVGGLTSEIDDVPKKSYASIVKVMQDSAAPSSTAAVVSVKYAVKSQNQQGAAAPPPLNMSEANASSINTKEIGNIQETEGLRDIPFSPNATPALVENEFKKFGPIKSGGVQVRTQKGFSFGFVEFEVASAVQSALEASPFLINGRHVVVEEKRSTNRGNSRIRFPIGRALGYRSDGPRGHGGNYGNGRGYGLGGDFNIGRDNGYWNSNQGGFSNHGSNVGYQRNDHMRANVGRNDHMRANVGRNDHMRANVGRNDHMRANVGRNDHMRANVGRNDHMRANVGRNDHMRANVGRNDHMRANVGRNDHMRANVGRNDHMRANVGRNDHMGASGDRVNRTGGSIVNAAPKTTTVRVPTSSYYQ